MTDEPNPYCKYGHYEEWDGLPECINEVLSAHEIGVHDERYVSGCPDCDEEIGKEMQAYRPHPNSLPYAEEEEGLAMRRRLPQNQ